MSFTNKQQIISEVAYSGISHYFHLYAPAYIPVQRHLAQRAHCELAGQLPARMRGQTFWPSAVVGKQRLSLRSSRQWARPAQLSPARGRVTDRAPTTTARTSRNDIGPRTTPTSENAEAVVQNNVTVQNKVAVPSNEVVARPVRQHRGAAVGGATRTTRCQPSHLHRRGIILHRFVTLIIIIIAAGAALWLICS